MFLRLYFLQAKITAKPWIGYTLLSAADAFGAEKRAGSALGAQELRGLAEAGDEVRLRGADLLVVDVPRSRQRVCNFLSSLLLASLRFFF